MSKEKDVRILSIILLVIFGLSFFGELLSLGTRLVLKINFGVVLINILLLVISLLICVGNAGMIARKEWGRKMTYVSLITYLIAGLIILILEIYTKQITGNKIYSSTILFAIEVILISLPIYYLNKRNVREVFTKAP
jgi:hypothetical protein